jgi:hypothetical protein
MLEINLVALAVSVAVAFVLSTSYYIAFANRYAELRRRMNPNVAVDTGTPPPWKILVELVRSLIVATVLAGLASLLELDGWTDGLILGVSMWIGFPVVLLVGSMVWDDVPGGLAAIHAGDWLVKLVVVSLIVSLWR